MDLANPTPVSVGQRAPDVQLHVGDGDPVRLSTLRAEAHHALILVFFRHFG